MQGYRDEDRPAIKAELVAVLRRLAPIAVETADVIEQSPFLIPAFLRPDLIADLERLCDNLRRIAEIDAEERERRERGPQEHRSPLRRPASPWRRGRRRR